MIKSWFKKFIFKRKNKGIIVIASIIVLIAVYKIAREAIRDYNTQNNFDIVSTENSINDTDNITSNKSKENDTEVAQEEGKSLDDVMDEGIFSALVGAAAGATIGPSTMKSICKVLGISENGTLGSLLTSRVVLAAVCGELGLNY